MLGTLGVLQTPYTQTVTAAKDAQFSLDGLDLTRLLQHGRRCHPRRDDQTAFRDGGRARHDDINITQNTDTIVQAVNTLATAYNAIQDFVTTQNKFTPPTDTTAGVAGTMRPCSATRR